MGELGKTLLAFAQLIGTVAWLAATAWLFMNRGTMTGLLSLFVPPAGVLLSFRTPLWPAVIAAALIGLVGAALRARSNA